MITDLHQTLAGARAIAALCGGHDSPVTDVRQGRDAVTIVHADDSLTHQVDITDWRAACGERPDSEGELRQRHEGYLASLLHDEAHAARHMAGGHMNEATDLCDDDCELINMADPDDALDAFTAALLEDTVLLDERGTAGSSPHVRLLHGFGGPNHEVVVDFHGTHARSSWAFNQIETDMDHQLDHLIEFFS